MQEEDDFVDEEIIEIFIEEGKEVLETINDFFPQWQSNRENAEARTEVRRAFHTLKGSGRMVQAYEIGELAWSVENMLNRVIDGTIMTTDGVFDIVRQVVDVLPGMLELFSDGKEQEVDVEPLMHVADAYSKGLTPKVDQSIVRDVEHNETALASVGDDENMPAFQVEISRQVADLAKTVNQLSIAVKGINQEITGLKSLVRNLEGSGTNSPAISDLKRDITSVKQECDKVAEEAQRSVVAFNQRINNVEKDAKSAIDKQSRQLSSSSNSLTKTINKINTSLHDVSNSVKGYAFGAAVFSITLALIFDLFLI